MLKTKNHTLASLISAWAVLVILIANISVAYSATVTITGSVGPANASNLAATDAPAGSGVMDLTWTHSPTPNLDAQRIEVTGPISLGVNFATYTIGGPDTSYTLPSLVIGWPYIIRHVSISGSLESDGIIGVFSPAPPPNPPPTVWSAPQIDQPVDKTEHIVQFDNGGINNPELACRVTSSLTDLNTDPLATIVHDSGWITCPTHNPLAPYEYTLTSLALNTIYYVHVQTREDLDLGPGTNYIYSAYSNVIEIYQYSGGSSSSSSPAPTVITKQCGNGITEYQEECDDGNRINNDGCDYMCNLEIEEIPAPICGNNIVELPEECDDGNTTDGDGCDWECNIEPEEIPGGCGDGIRTPPEECDDGNNQDGDWCSSTCFIEQIIPICGNNDIEEPETCDDGNLVSGDGCSSTCEIEHAAPTTCGNAILEEPEECDDGNVLNGDGCNENCEIEEIATITLTIKGAPEYRMIYDDNPNLSLNAMLGIYKPEIESLDTVLTTLDDYGEVNLDVQIVTGLYDFYINGEAHNNKIIRGVVITDETTTVNLDFTYAETVMLTAGDTFDDNRINSLDIAAILGSYKIPQANSNDLNQDGKVNALDIAVLMWNYQEEGEYL